MSRRSRHVGAANIRPGVLAHGQAQDLASGDGAGPSRSCSPPFEMQPHATGARSGIEINLLNRLSTILMSRTRFLCVTSVRWPSGSRRDGLR